MRSSVLVFAALASLLVACGDSAPPPKTAEPTRAQRREAKTSAAPVSAASGASHSTGMSYDDALAIPEDLNDVKNEKDLSDQEVAAPMQSGAYLQSCEAPDSMKVTIRVAVRDGRALGVSVVTDPDDPTIAECIDKAVRELTWPTSHRRETMTTRF